MRSGFLTEAGLQGKPLGDAMAMSGHKTVSVAMGYYQARSRVDLNALNLIRLAVRLNIIGSLTKVNDGFGRG